MNSEILERKRRVYELTGDFSSAATSAMVALNTPPLTDDARALVLECQAVSRAYGEALDELLAALDEQGPDPEEKARMVRLKELLGRELGLLAAHPALNA